MPTYLACLKDNSLVNDSETVLKCLPSPPLFLSIRNCSAVYFRLFRSQYGTWCPQRSKWWKGYGCYSRIIRLYPQCCRLKWFLRPLHVQDNPGHPGKGHWYFVVTLGNLTSNTWGRCSAWLTGSRIQSIACYVPFRRMRWAVIDPAANSTPHFGNGIRCRSIYR